MTEPVVTGLLLATVAAAAIPAGAALARLERLLPAWLDDEFRHSVIAFGAGALFSAVALVLVPDGAARVHPVWAVALFVAGGVAFVGIDRRIARSGGGAGQLMAMLLDFIPECLALGALLATGDGAALLLALMIGLQNLPEGFNAFRELRQDRGMATGTVLLAFAGLACLGPVAALIGMTVLAGADAALGGIMLFAAGGILYVVFQDIAPQVRLDNRFAPPLGAVLGFALGLGGHLLLHG